MNFCFPVPPCLENNRLRLVPWISSIHSPLFFQSLSKHPELLNYTPIIPWGTAAEFDTWIEEYIQKNDQIVLFAVINKPQNKPHRVDEDQLESPLTQMNVSSEDFAGMIGLLNTSVTNQSTEIGFVIMLPAFHRTHVASNAVGLLLKWLLDTHDDTNTHALGLNRVNWVANVLNTKSIRLAERMGFKFEGVSRWERTLPKGKEEFGKPETRKGDPKEECPGRDTARLGICWDDWAEGGRALVETAMARTS